MLKKIGQVLLLGQYSVGKTALTLSLTLSADRVTPTE